MDKEFNPVGWFEIPVKDMARAKAFYEHLFKIQLEEHDFGPIKMAWFPMFEGAIGAAGSLVLADGYNPSTNGVLVYFTAPDIEAHQKRVKEKGGQCWLKNSASANSVLSPWSRIPKATRLAFILESGDWPHYRVLIIPVKPSCAGALRQQVV
jgi:predicted enzyme related to lactoylglutathione lyase